MESDSIAAGGHALCQGGRTKGLKAEPSAGCQPGHRRGLTAPGYSLAARSDSLSAVQGGVPRPPSRDDTSPSSRC